MGRWTWVVALGGALLLGGCFGMGDDNSFYDAPKPLDKMSHEELCTFYGHYRDNPELSAQGKEIAARQMRAKGCS